MRIPCVLCKGRDPRNCGRSFCPITAKAESMFRVKDALKSMEKEDFFGSAPAPFVGRYGYPHINVGILSPPEKREDAWLYDAPKTWSEMNLGIRSIIDLRSSLINSRFKADIKDRSRFLEISQEVGMASKPVEVEIRLEKKPFFRLTTDPYMAPTGPNAKLKKVEITENPKIHTKVDKVVSDNGLKASEAINYLYKSEFDENFLSKLLSVGTVGLKPNRKLVPTRWSITAVDDTIGKQLLKNIKDFPESEYLAFFGGYLGNYYLILFFPEVWSYELFEMYMPEASWNITKELKYTTDYETYDGRKDYAENCAGGYYAARLAILEKLSAMKRQSGVLALRFITGEYAVPLGVWVVREATRKSLSEKPLNFGSKELMINYAKQIVKKKFGCDINGVLEKSLLLRNIKSQTKLRRFFV